ncbi:unnamed protein product [Rotaria magnacalcarata]|uniref:Uncharacterized protein n=1 Tax=Rotaria magnacalcarata TaxID=392030 RepID=A0A8S3AIT2_9BILA|nr:unnamed protein product [Rotaria magnacalcarata]CAF4719600.1 unnamed protein product [Rotaria magnacalcarata]
MLAKNVESIAVAGRSGRNRTPSDRHKRLTTVMFALPILSDMATPPKNNSLLKYQAILLLVRSY